MLNNIADVIADVIGIGLIYTKLITFDNTVITIPNQKLLQIKIRNYGKKQLVRRKCTVTIGFESEYTYVEKALLEAVIQVEKVLKTPKSYVQVIDFQNFAVEYTLFYYINDVKNLNKIDAEVKKKVLKKCKEYDIDLRTPFLIQEVRTYDIYLGIPLHFLFS